MTTVEQMHNFLDTVSGKCPNCEKYKNAYERLVQQNRELINMKLRIYKSKLRPDWEFVKMEKEDYLKYCREKVESLNMQLYFLNEQAKEVIDER